MILSLFVIGHINDVVLLFQNIYEKIS